MVWFIRNAICREIARWKVQIQINAETFYLMEKDEAKYKTEGTR